MPKKTPLFILSVFGIWSIFQLSPTNALALTSAGGSGGSGGGSCTEAPIQIDLFGDLNVEMVDDQPQVFLQWGRVNGQDPFLKEKVDVFMNYLKENPTVGLSQNKLATAFAMEAYAQLSRSENPLTQSKLKEALASTLQGSRALSSRNIETLFTDYYPYLFVDQLKSQPELAKAMVTGVEKGLTTEMIDPSVLLKSVVSNLKEVRSTGAINDTVSCMNRVVGKASLEEFKPSASNQVYGSKGKDMQAVIETLKQEGKVQPILDAITHDRELVAETKQALKVGINSVIDVWAANPNVQNLISLYEQDPEMRKLADLFFETSLGSDLDECVRDAYRGSLLEVTGETYLNLITPQLASNKMYSDEETTVVLQALEKMLNDGNTSLETSNITLNFINDYLTLEEAVADASSIGTPFAEVYHKNLSSITSTVEGMEIEIQRDGQVIGRLKNSDITQFVDREVPLNTSGAMAYHDYKVVTQTACASKEGNSAQAKINPKLKDGTPVNALGDIELKLKDSQTDYFMERLQILLESLKNDQSISGGLENASKISDPKACDASREALLISKTSDKLFDYVLNCFGDAETNEVLQKQMKDIVSPLIRFLELNQFTDTDKITELFLAPVIEMARVDYNVRMEIMEKAKPLVKSATTLLGVKQMDDFNEEQKKLIKCGGVADCPEAIQKLMERYFFNASHAADIEVQVYDEAGKMVTSKTAHTDIFGRADQVALGELKTGKNYEFRVKLVGQPYALPKVSRIRINNATPVAGNQFEATVDLKSPTTFFYGNFDNSNNLIDLKDVEAWSALITEDPRKWSSYNVDGFKGLDLFDANSLQTHWGTQAESAPAVRRLSTAAVAKIFGYAGGNEEAIYTPAWLLKIQSK